MATVTFTLDNLHTELGFEQPFSFEVERRVKLPTGKTADIKNSKFPRTNEERNMLIREIFKRGQEQQQLTGTFPKEALAYISKNALDSQSNLFQSELQAVADTSQRMYEDPLGTSTALKKFTADNTPYTTRFAKNQEKLANIPFAGPVIAAGAFVPNLAAEAAMAPFVPGDPESGLPLSYDDIVEDAITFAKRRLPNDLQSSGRLGAIIAADAGLLLALKRAPIHQSAIPVHKDFLMNKVLRGLVKTSRSQLGTPVALGTTSSLGSMAFDTAYAYANRYYRDSYPTRFKMNDKGEFILNDKGEKIPEQPPIAEDTLAALNQAKYEFMVSGGAAAAFNMGGFLWRNFLSKSTGIGAKDISQKDLSKLATEYGIPLSIISATPRDAIKGYAKVVGVFPFVGSPLKEGQNSAKAALYKELEKTFVELAPYNVTKEILQNISSTAVKDFQQNFKNFAGTKAVLYEAFDDLADQIDEPFIPTNRVTEYLGNIVTKSRADIPLENNETYFSNVREVLSGVVGDPNAAAKQIEAITALANMPEHLTANQFRELQKNINDAIRKLNPQTGGVTADAMDSISTILTNISKNLRYDKDDINNWKQMSGKNELLAGEAKKRLDYANTFFYANKNDFASFFKGSEGTTRLGKLIETKVNQRFFQPNAPAAPGEFQIDQLFDFIMDSKNLTLSMKAQEEMYRQLGPESYNSMVAAWLDTQLGRNIDMVSYPRKKVTPGLTEAGEPDVASKVLAEKEMQSTSLNANIPILDVAGLRKSLGMLPSPTVGGIQARSDAAAVQNMFKLSGKKGEETYKKLDDLLTLAETVQSFDISDVSQFVQRRAVLGGARSAALALTGAGIATNPLGSLGVILLSRGVSSYLADPKAYKNMMSLLDDSLSPALRRNVALELVRFADQQYGFDADEGEVRPSLITDTATGASPIVRQAPGSEKSRKKAQDQVLGIEKYYGKKVEALSIPEMIEYFAEQSSYTPTTAYANYIKLGEDGGKLDVKSVNRLSSNSPFENQLRVLSDIDPASTLAKSIFGEKKGEEIAQFSKAKAEVQDLGNVDAGSGTYVVPGNYGKGFTKKQKLGPNPFLTGLSRFYQTNVAPAMNMAGSMSTFNTMGNILQTPGKVNQFFRGVDQRFGLGPQNRLNPNQKIAMSDGNLNQAIAARFNKGGIATMKGKK
tara:strand:- start:1337 stop:4849 length:3513 start_codon:yes stop_codon:yes gene_type:complete